MKEFFEKHKNDIFRYWIRKRMWTPYEVELKDPYQAEYGDEECSHGYIVEIVDLGYDWLIGISESLDATYVEYFKLSDIELAFSDTDQNIDD